MQGDVREAGAEGLEDVGSEEEAEDDVPPPIARMEVPLPPALPEDVVVMHRVRTQAKNILENMNNMKGITTYRTTWNSYRRWHERVTGQYAPTCKITELLWLDARMGTHFVTDMASQGMTMPQMASARSGLNWLIMQHHTLQAQIHFGLPPPAKLSSKDPVRM